MCVAHVVYLIIALPIDIDFVDSVANCDCIQHLFETATLQVTFYFAKQPYNR